MCRGSYLTETGSPKRRTGAHSKRPQYVIVYYLGCFLCINQLTTLINNIYVLSSGVVLINLKLFGYVFPFPPLFGICCYGENLVKIC